MEEFKHEALELIDDKKLIYIAYSKHFAFFRSHISKYVLENGAVPLNPFLLFGYFLIDTVDRAVIREANNNLVKRADEIWVFGPISDGVLAEIKIAQKQKKPIKYFQIKNSRDILPITRKQDLEMEREVKDFKNEINFPKKKIVICGSMRFAEDILVANKKLEENDWQVVMPWGIEDFLPGADFLTQREDSGWEPMEGAKRKIEHDLIKAYHNEIETSDAILVINKEKNGIENYIGGNTFLEMGFAHCLGKKIYCLNPLNPEQKVFYQESVAFEPIIINEDLTKIV